MTESGAPPAVETKYEFVSERGKLALEYRKLLS